MAVAVNIVLQPSVLFPEWCSELGPGFQTDSFFQNLVMLVKMKHNDIGIIINKTIHKSITKFLILLVLIVEKLFAWLHWVYSNGWMWLWLHSLSQSSSEARVVLGSDSDDCALTVRAQIRSSSSSSSVIFHFSFVLPVCGCVRLFDISFDSWRRLIFVISYVWTSSFLLPLSSLSSSVGLASSLLLHFFLFYSLRRKMARRGKQYSAVTIATASRRWASGVQQTCVLPLFLCFHLPLLD